MNAKKTLILAVVLAALAAVVVFWELPQQREKERTDLEGDKILDLAYDAINKIELERGDEKLAFEKEATGEDWRMKKPFDDESERWIVQSLISAVRYAHPTRTLDKPGAEALTRFGLDKPRAVLTFDAGSVTKRLRIGAKNPIGQTVYLKPEDRDVVFLVPESTLASLDKPADDFRRRDLLAPADPTLKINRLTIAVAGRPELTLVPATPPKTEGEKDAAPEIPEDQIWHLDEPTGPVADQETVRTLLDLVSGLKAARFIGPLGAENQNYGLDKPSLTVTAVYGEGDKQKTLTLTIGGTAEAPTEWYATVSGRPYVAMLLETAFQGLRLERADLRDRRLLAGIDPAKVESIDLQSAKTSFKISRSVDGWQFADETPADKESVEKCLRAVAKWRAQELADGPRGARLARAVKGNQVTSLVLTDADGKVLESIRFSEPLDPGKIAPVKKAVAKAETEEKPAESAERLVALVANGYPNTAYLVKPDVLNDLPGSIEEFKATERDDAKQAAAAGGQLPSEVQTMPPAEIPAAAPDAPPAE